VPEWLDFVTFNVGQGIERERGRGRLTVLSAPVLSVLGGA
jgi:hypothetical protein